jgi:putative phosphoesterase
MIVHAGDLVELRVLDILKAVCPNTKAVCGNMDAYEVRRGLPEREIIKIANYKIGVIHGYGAPNRLIDLVSQSFKNDALDIIIFGHSHTGFSEKIKDILYFNPGSPSDKIFSPYNSYGIIEINDKIEAKIIKL